MVTQDSTEKLRGMKQRGEKITALTAYDYPTARLLDESGIDIILIGDSLGRVVLEYQDTTRVTLEELLHHTRAVEKAGAFSVVLEIVVADIAKQITHAVDIPTIGIGSGEHCAGQILVTHDLIGLFPWFTPKFVSPQARVADEIRNAARAFIERTRGSGTAPSGG